MTLVAQVLIQNTITQNTICGGKIYTLHVFLIINQLDALISRIYSWNKTLHVSDSSPVQHQEFFTVHTAMVYVIQVY